MLRTDTAPFVFGVRLPRESADGIATVLEDIATNGPPPEEDCTTPGGSARDPEAGELLPR
ncbi:hypothetical protein [Streptomyces sp. 2131.1]|uniref:hypothetical protein n=1 Tax=Streptomyces sp. 2131.1 TaxID=1855346 RepID=UPI000D1A2F42|nr:hypothetical protein [Streptomyces sp. 2131.1]